MSADDSTLDLASAVITGPMGKTVRVKLRSFHDRDLYVRCSELLRVGEEVLVELASTEGGEGNPPRARATVLYTSPGGGSPIKRGMLLQVTVADPEVKSAFSYLPAEEAQKVKEWSLAVEAGKDALRGAKVPKDAFRLPLIVGGVIVVAFVIVFVVLLLR